MGNGDLVDPGAATVGAIACLDIESRNILWRHEFQSAVLGSVVVIRAEVICGTTDGVVHVFSDDGRLKWEWDSGAPLAASLAVTNDYICGVNTSGKLFLLSRIFRQLVSETSLGQGGQFLSSPAIAHRQIYVGTELHGLQCLGH
jgi:outer membrane protein assembly factor BamB